MAKNGTAIAEQPALTEAPAEDERWQIKVSFDNLGVKRAFVKASNEAAMTNDEGALFPWMVKFIAAWPFEGLDPKNADDYDKLTLDQWEECVKRVSHAIATFRAKAV